MTMRNRARGGWRVVIPVLAALAAGGCATPGPLHVYTVANPAANAIHDTGGTPADEIPSFLARDERIAGFAYDPFTDHFFLRLAPGNRIRVVDRPARAVKREFTIDALVTAADGDLAVKPRDGHIFLFHSADPAVIELSRLGRFVRTIALRDLPAPAIGIAYDSIRDVLFLLHRGSPSRITTYDLAGRRLESLPLERESTGSLAFDAEKREFYAPLAATGGAGPSGVGVFDERGRWRRTVPLNVPFIDVGPRSLVRVF